MMKKLIGMAVSLGLLCGCGTEAVSKINQSKKKLKVFILAGQSNMVGHANYITIPDLLTLDNPRAKELAALLFKKGAITPGMARDLIETLFKKDDLANSLAQGKIVGDKAIAEAGAELKKLQAACDDKTKKIKDAFTVSDRVYITSIADGHLRSGKLTMGYGGGFDTIGPELGFGLSLAQDLDAPILLIKTSWGGKSLYYDFRPPSAPYELDEGGKKLDNPEYVKKVAKDREEYAKVWLPNAKKAIAAFWKEHDKFMAKNLSKERYAEWQKEVVNWDKRIKEDGGIDKLEKWMVWAQERNAQNFLKGTGLTPPTMNINEFWKSRPALADAKTAQDIKDAAGHFYRAMNTSVREVLKDLKKYHPEYDPEAGYEIAGFVWFQGFNDQFSPECSGNYKNNMIAFVKDIRKEYKVQNMPFVIGILGTGGTKENVDKNPVSVAQREAAAVPEFKDNVAGVESYPFYEIKAAKMWGDRTWNKPEHRVEFAMIASEKPYHYMGSGKFFVRVGDAFAKAMADLMSKQK